MRNLKVCCLMLTAGRHFCAQRALSFFLDQDYPERHLLIYQNSPIPLEIDRNVNNRMVSVINCNIDSQTLKPYTSLGAIYNDALMHIPSETDVVNIYDDDDIRLPFFLTENIKGYHRALTENKMAYKSRFSYFRDEGIISKVENTLESSIFVAKEHLISNRFSLTNVDHHFKWLSPLVKNNLILVDQQGKPGYCYCWRENIPIYKTSGYSDSPNTFENYRKANMDYGDGILRRLNPFYIKYLYKQLGYFAS